jgi:hypothetical protein
MTPGSYAYAIGTGGIGGSAYNTVGCPGADGQIIVEEYY